jgi:hypothetical protein
MKPAFVISRQMSRNEQGTHTNRAYGRFGVRNEGITGVRQAPGI